MNPIHPAPQSVTVTNPPHALAPCKYIILQEKGKCKQGSGY